MQAFRWLLEYEFARNAMFTGIAVGTLCSMLSVLVVLKRMAFIGEGISHAGFGGVGTAIFFGLVGFQQDLVVLLFCVAVATTIAVLTRRRALEPDSAIGIALVAAMAWGIFTSDLRRNLQGSQWYRHYVGAAHPAPRIEDLLFGSLLSVSRTDMLTSIAAGVAILLILWFFFKPILFYSFDPQASAVSGVRTTAIHYLIPVIISLAIVLTIRLAGFVLSSAMLVIPGTTAMLLSRRLFRVISLSWLVGAGGTAVGILLSLELGNVSSGACIVGVLCLVFAGVFLSTSMMRRGISAT